MDRQPRTRVFLVIIIALVSFSVIGCGEKVRELPIEKIKQMLSEAPTYSIVLEDMKTEGNFFKNYFHKYRVVQEEEGWTTDWLQVPKRYYETNENFLGMVLAARKEGENISGVTPPGYAYVGDSRYGRWRTDSHGNSFWEWYGKYALFSSLFGGWYRPIYMHDYRGYSSYRSRNQTYFGRNKQFGSSGSIVRQAKPNFYARHMAKVSSTRSSFSNKVSKRIGRTRSSFRSRAGGFGK